MDIKSFVEVSGALDRLRTISDTKPIEADADLHAETGHDSAAALFDGLLKPLSDHPTVTLALVAALVIFLLVRFGGGRAQPIAAVAKGPGPIQDDHVEPPITQETTVETVSDPKAAPGELTAHSLKEALDSDIVDNGAETDVGPQVQAVEASTSTSEDAACIDVPIASATTQEVIA